jgi:hypothetical protein
LLLVERRAEQEALTMKTKQTTKSGTKAKKPAGKANSENLPVGKRQAGEVKGGRIRYR